MMSFLQKGLLGSIFAVPMPVCNCHEHQITLECRKERFVQSKRPFLTSLDKSALARLVQTDLGP